MKEFALNPLFQQPMQSRTKTIAKHKPQVISPNIIRLAFTPNAHAKAEGAVVKSRKMGVWNLSCPRCRYVNEATEHPRFIEHASIMRGCGLKIKPKCPKSKARICCSSFD
jgi:phage FluMu protein Com